MTNKGVVVRRRGGEYVAHVAGDTRRWERGCTPEDAVGRLVVSYPWLAEGLRSLDWVYACVEARV